jgi:two-component system NtrC family sensor kinase
MNAYAWNATGPLFVPAALSGRGAAALVILAASLLVFRAFRERYLLIWVLGWSLYWLSFSGHPASLSAHRQPYSLAAAQVEFVLAIGLFTASVLVYSHSAKLLRPLLFAVLALSSYAVLRVLLWPESVVLRAGLELGYRLLSLSAAIELIRFRWGRWGLGACLFALSLALLHLDWAPWNRHLFPGMNLLLDLMFGLSMLVVVFDDVKLRTLRLGVLKALTTSISRAQQYRPMMATAVAELKSLMAADAAWVRLLEGDKLSIAEHLNLSGEYLREMAAISLDPELRRALEAGEPVLTRASSAPAWLGRGLRRQRFHHVVTVSVEGKNSMIGTLSLARRHSFSYTPDDMNFLSGCAHQLGLAVENLRLVEQILRSQRQWANTFDSIPDLVLLHDSEFRVMKANRALLERLERSPSEVVGKRCAEVLPREGDAWAECPYCRAGGHAFHEGEDPCFGGLSIVSSSCYAEQGSKQTGTVHVVHDVSERRQAEEKYRLLFEQVQEGVFFATPDGKLLDCNNALVRMLGYSSRETLMSLDLERDLYASPEEREALRREVERHDFVRNFEVSLRRNDGAILVAVESGFATRDSTGKIERYQGFVLDITEKRRAEDEIRRRNRELNALNAMAVIATQSFDLDEVLNLTLRQVVSLLGAETGSISLSDTSATVFRRRASWGQLSAERSRPAEVNFPGGFGDLVTRSRTEVVTTEYLPHLPSAVADFVRSGAARAGICVLLWGKDSPIGLMVISRANSRQYTNNDENFLVAIGRQLATTIEKVRLYEETCRAYEDLRRTQEQLLQSEKMSAVGQLIAGVAHELNNPLTAILGYAQLLEGEGLNDRATAFVAKLYKQAQRTHRIVQNLLSFARQRKPQRQELDVRKVVEEALGLREYDIKMNNIELGLEIEGELPSVVGDPHQLEQVFLNVVNNAVDAMLETGRGGSLRVRIRAHDGLVGIEFEDSGPGIREPNRIFEPFYTTKSVGKGTGLGLSICYGIVKEHGGDIVARNAKTGGAIVEIRLPAAGGALPLPAPAAVAPRQLALEGRILLVEEEEAVLEFERDVLNGAGAQVVAVTEFERAQQLLASENFDALLFNGRMRGWTAKEIFTWLGQNRPELRKHLLFTFSSLAEPEIRAFLREQSSPYLVKPFEVAELISSARRLLTKAQAAVAG